MARRRRKKSKLKQSSKETMSEASAKVLTGRETPPLLSIPTEVRSIIWKCLFEDPRVGIDYENPYFMLGETKLFREGGFCLNILRVNKLFRTETQPFIANLRPMVYQKMMPVHNDIRRLMIKIPPEWVSRITKISLPSAGNYRCCMFRMENLREVRLNTKVFHFQQRYRPADNASVVRRITKNINQDLQRIGMFPVILSWEPRLRYRFNLKLTVWYFNLQLPVSEGWKIKYDISNNEVTSIQPATFIKNMFDETKLLRFDMTRTQQNYVLTSWKYSPDGWWIKKLGEKVMVDEIHLDE